MTITPRPLENLLRRDQDSHWPHHPHDATISRWTDFIGKKVTIHNGEKAPNLWRSYHTIDAHTRKSTELAIQPKLRHHCCHATLSTRARPGVMMSDKDEPGGFVFNQAIPGTNQTTDATASFQPNEYSPKEFGDLERYLRDKRGWSQERLCTILNRRFDPGWNRIKALVTLEAMELGEETSLWVVGLVFGTLLDVAPDALDDFHAAIASTALPAADDDQPTPDQLDHKELRELVEWINLDNLEPHDRKALLHMMMERAERCEAFQPTTATPEETAPKAPITSERQVEQREESGNMGFTLNTSRSGMDESETPQDEATIQDEGTEQPAESTQSTEAERPFSRPILVNAVLNGVDLSDAILRGADMRGAQLQGANLKGADLSYADLSSADLAGANLRGANLTHANLKGADLRSAIMREALIEGANLEKAKI